MKVIVVFIVMMEEFLLDNSKVKSCWDLWPQFLTFVLANFLSWNSPHCIENEKLPHFHVSYIEIGRKISVWQRNENLQKNCLYAKTRKFAKMRERRNAKTIEFWLLGGEVSSLKIWLNMVHRRPKYWLFKSGNANAFSITFGWPCKHNPLQSCNSR